jgi:hypothetical protein
MRAPVGVVLKFPQMDDLVNRPGVGMEIPDEVLIVASLTQCRKAKLLVEFHCFGHRADAQRVGPQLV